MVAVVVFEFSVMRCQPLRRALAILVNSYTLVRVISDYLFKENYECLNI